jgi:hypothetical protein
MHISVTKIHMQFIKLLDSGRQWVTQNHRAYIFVKKNSCCYIKLVLIPLFRELTEEENVWDSILSY